MASDLHEMVGLYISSYNGMDGYPGTIDEFYEEFEKNQELEILIRRWNHTYNEDVEIECSQSISTILNAQ